MAPGRFFVMVLTFPLVSPSFQRFFIEKAVSVLLPIVPVFSDPPSSYVARNEFFDFSLAFFRLCSPNVDLRFALFPSPRMIN